MLSIQGTGRAKRIAFRKESGEVIRKIPGLIAARKHVISEAGWSKLRKAENVFCFVSSPKIYRQDKLRSLSSGWCHALKDNNLLPKGKPHILLPESDFLDRSMVAYTPNTIKYDYFYFTINAKGGIKNKGLLEFLDILPALAYYKLKGKVVVYFPNSGRYHKFVVKLSQKHRQALKDHSKYVSFHWGFLNSQQMNDLMTSCRFGLFPNTEDNSPRIISEALIRNVPIMVNEKIHGGWHYVNKETGFLYNKSNLGEALDFMMTNDFHPRDFYEAHYGFKRSSKRLAVFLKELFGYDDVTHAYFCDFSKYLDRIDD